MSEEELRKTLKDCVNELCLYCGRYKERHLGACDGCRWKKVLELATNLQPTCNNVATNADRIRAMSDEELAEFLIQDGDCPPERMYPDGCPNCDRVTPKVCCDCWLDWLRQEAKE